MQHKDNLILASAAIARSTPDLWAAFLEALSGDFEYQKENLINSPSCDVERMQGRAQAMSTLLKTLDKCKEEAEKITNARKARP